MPDGDAFVPIAGSAGYNVRTIKVTQWILDPTTGVGTWNDTAMQVLVLANKRGDAVDTDELMGEVLAELRTIRELMQSIAFSIA